MTPKELAVILDGLLKLPDETEWVEFKEAKNSFDFKELGQYFSALSNEANLKGKEFGWLVFGVEDKTHKVVGSQFRPVRKDLDSLKHEVAKKTGGITFVEIHEVAHPSGRVVLFQIPPALRGVPTQWQGHYYGRDGGSLGPLGLNELEQIRKQSRTEDWSAGIVEGASVADLDPAAVKRAREEFKKKNSGLAAEVDGWDDATFLNKAKVCISGKVTRAAIILLGKPEAASFLVPAQTRITWVLKDDKGVEKDYAHFDCPFILNTDAVFAKIRNLTYRYLKDNNLFPEEVSTYDPWVIREALHNCIGHQDYSLNGKITVTEFPDCLVFTSVGSFAAGSVESVIERDSPPEFYRNPFLSQAMVALNMIDTIGSGIRRMFIKQRERLFPMPDFDLSDPQRVKVIIPGKIIDPNYSRVLYSQTDLSLPEVIALDRVQKRWTLSSEQFAALKAKGVIEGRKPNYVVSAKIAALTDTRAEYIKHRTLDKQHYKGLVVEYLKKFECAQKRDIEKFMLDKLPDALNQQQKRNYVRNLLQEMRREGTIRPDKPRRGAKWGLANPLPEETA